MQLADPDVQTGSTIDNGITSFNYECPSSCTRQMTPDITVFGELLHMHEVGYAMRTDVYTEQREFRLRHEAEYYQFHTQQNHLFAPFTIRRGDILRTRCTYRNTGATRVFGIASADEMCIHFLYYYPIQTITKCGLDNCGSLLTVERGQSDADLERDFGIPCGGYPSPPTSAPGSGPTPTIAPSSPSPPNTGSTASSSGNGTSGAAKTETGLLVMFTLVVAALAHC